jgi:hypothetical protein
LVGAVGLGVLAAFWAPGPLWRIGARIALGVGSYARLLLRLIRDALASFDPEDPTLSPRARARIASIELPDPRRTLPLTPVQRRYLAAMRARQRYKE